MAQMLPADNIYLWRHQDHEALEPKLLEVMTGIAPSMPFDLGEATEATRASLTSRALSELSKRRSSVSRLEHQRVAKRLMAHYPPSSEFAAFNPWSSSEKQSWQQRYSRDIELIQTRFPNLQFLKPGSKKSHDPALARWPRKRDPSPSSKVVPYLWISIV